MRTFKEWLNEQENIPELTDGYIKFKHRNFSHRGDKSTWVRYDEKTHKLTVNVANKGIVSRAYADELEDFCKQFGINFKDLHSGERVTVDVRR